MEYMDLLDVASKMFSQKKKKKKKKEKEKGQPLKNKRNKKQRILTSSIQYDWILSRESVRSPDL